MASSGPDAQAPRCLWQPRDTQSTQMYQFTQAVNKKRGLSIQNYAQLHDYSISRRSDFWSDWFDNANIIHGGSYTQAVDESRPIDTVPIWFDGVTLNFAENVLFSRQHGDGTGVHSTRHKEASKIAIMEVNEGAVSGKDFTWDTLRRDTSRLASALKVRGVGRGDVVFVVGSNSYTTLTLFLATTHVGGIFTSCSPDMGEQGLLQRINQVDPKFVFIDGSMRYNGKDYDLTPKASKVVENVKSKNFQKLVLVPRQTPQKITSPFISDQIEELDGFLSHARDETPPFERLPFHAPCLISYSSGTTGEPKCIVHSVGGIVINSLKEGVLHGDMGPDSTLLQYTTTGWIMYLACVASLIPGCRTILYDGSPFFPRPATFLKLISKQKVTALGTSPRWMSEFFKLGIKPRELVDLSSLTSVSSTGMVLPEQLFEWFYDEGFPSNVRLANMSGGTDIAGCFAMGNPISPLYVGGCQGPALGVSLRVYDSGSPDGKAREVAVPGEAGELVVDAAFPNIPVCFWNDAPLEDHTRSRYFGSYFGKYPHVWAHGDFVSVSPATRAIHFHGRADGVLNPSGIRFGSSEIYNVLEKNFADFLIDSLCVGQRRPQDSDETVLLFLQIKAGSTFDQNLVKRVKQVIGKELSRRHVPKHVFQVPDIPVTANFKKVELPVKRIVSGQRVVPSTSIVNPKSLDFFYQFADIEAVIREQTAKL